MPYNDPFFGPSEGMPDDMNPVPDSRRSQASYYAPEDYYHQLMKNPGDTLEGWERRRQDMLEIGFDRTGFRNFMSGGYYAPERIMRMYEDQMGATPEAVQAAQMRAAGPSAGLGYARQAMDIGNRAAMLQAGAAFQGTMGMSPAARAAIAMGAARAGAGAMGNAGLSAYQQGLGLEQAANERNAMMNQEAALYNNQQLWNERARQAGMLGSSLDRAYGASMDASTRHFNAMREYWGIRREDQQAQDAAWESGISGGLGAVGGVLPTGRGSRTASTGYGNPYGYDQRYGNPYGYDQRYGNPYGYEM